MILIASAAYIDDVMSTEIGKLPPSFLPVGNRRLFLYQIELVKKTNGNICLSLPRSFRCGDFDKRQLQNNNTRIIRTPDKFSLGESIVHCWRTARKKDDSLSILYGNTLYRNSTLLTGDALAIHSRPNFNKHSQLGNKVSNVHSASSKLTRRNIDALSGYFSFSDPARLIRYIEQNRFCFASALSAYANGRRLSIIEGGERLDFSHIEGYFYSRTIITTERAFNDLRISKGIVVKAGADIKKISAEAMWFKNLPAELKVHTPKIIESKTNAVGLPVSYSLEYLHLLPLNDLFVHGNLNVASWEHIIRSCKRVLENFKRYSSQSVSITSINNLYLSKTLERLDEFAQSAGYEFLQSTYKGTSGPSQLALLFDIAKQSARYIPATTHQHVAITHGDFCFSNALYDSRALAIKLIDPRGIDGTRNETIYGDWRYDLAKLHHSAVGLYDYIIAGRYCLRRERGSSHESIHFPDSAHHTSIEKIFREMFFEGKRELEREIVAITLQLFISMLPLHYDKPEIQRAIFANTTRIYRMLERLS